MMKIGYLRAFISTLTFCLLLIGGLNQDALGQGKGKGGGNPHGGPPGQEKHGGGGDRGGGNRGNGGWQQQRPQPQPQQVFRQQEYRMPPGQARKQERVYQQPAPQQVWRQQAPQQVWRQQAPQQVWRQQQQEQRAYRMPPGQAKKQQQAYIPAPVYQDRGRGNGRGRDQRENVAPWSGDWVPPGQIRSAEVHQRNAERKAEREAARSYGRQYQQPYYAPYVAPPVYGNNRSYRYDQGSGYTQQYYSAPSYQTYQSYVPQYVSPYRYSGGGGYLNYSPMYVPNTYIYEPYTAYATYPDNYGYSSPYYGYDNGGSDWKSMLVRTLIGFVLGNQDNGSYGLEPYDPYYGYGGYGPSYASYGSSYNDYYPNSYSRGYVQPVYDYSGYDVPLVNLMPMQDLFGPSYGGYSSDTLREVLAQGYEQGYQAGWYARDNQLRDNYLSNGYRVEDDYYDPYSYSIGENRRCFSEGYSIGYQDAFNGRQGYISQNSGGTDLLSLLLSNVIGTV